MPAVEVDYAFRILGTMQVGFLSLKGELEFGLEFQRGLLRKNKCIEQFPVKRDWDYLIFLPQKGINESLCVESG